MRKVFLFIAALALSVGVWAQENTNRHQLNERKQASIERLTFAVNSYAVGETEGDSAGYARGLEEGIATGKAELLGNMGEPCIGCTAVDVKKGGKVVTLYAPERVDYIRK